jgi:hypothetical protein
MSGNSARGFERSEKRTPIVVPLSAIRTWPHRGVIALLLVAALTAFCAGAEANTKASDFEQAAATPVPTPSPDTPEGRFYKVAADYARKKQALKRQYGNQVIAWFDTEAGPIGFGEDHLLIYGLRGKPMEQGVAWLRLSKRNSNENGAAVEAFLNGARKSRAEAGYKLVRKNTVPVDYGNATTALMTRGDEYFKTYFQTTRVANPESETSYSMAYTYYIEMGLQSRRKQWEKEHTVNKLGE